MLVETPDASLEEKSAGTDEAEDFEDMGTEEDEALSAYVEGVEGPKDSLPQQGPAQEAEEGEGQHGFVMLQAYRKLVAEGKEGELLQKINGLPFTGTAMTIEPSPAILPHATSAQIASTETDSKAITRSVQLQGEKSHS